MYFQMLIASTTTKWKIQIRVLTADNFQVSSGAVWLTDPFLPLPTN